MAASVRTRKVVVQQQQQSNGHAADGDTLDDAPAPSPLHALPPTLARLTSTLPPPLSTLAHYSYNVLTNRQYFMHLLLYVCVAELVLSIAIIHLISYTEIDWIAYMQQVETFVHRHEHDYTKIEGGTGPLVYPALHLYVYTALYYITSNGTNIRLAQYIFAVLNTLTTLVTALIYHHCGPALPQSGVLLLLCSKRIHSIFVLRLFNDTIAMLFAHLSILLMQYNHWLLAAVLYSCGVAVKMNVLLMAPAVGLLMMQRFDVVGVMQKLSLCFAVQVIVALPFLTTHPLQYLSRAFEFSRVFFYKWTVNWRMLPEDVFLSKSTSYTLLVLHLTALVYLTNQMLPAGGIRRVIVNNITPYISAARKQLQQYSKTSSPTSQQPSSFTIATLCYTANLVGIAFARSLHYQFYAWYFHTLPILLTAIVPASVPWGLRLAILAAIEYCWNVYPSTPFSSSLLFGCHLLLLLSCALRYGRGVHLPEAELASTRTTDSITQRSRRTVKYDTASNGHHAD